VAQRLLRHALDRPAAHPAPGCPIVTAELDRLAAGMTVGQGGRLAPPLMHSEPARLTAACAVNRAAAPGREGDRTIIRLTEKLLLK
jgi:hypothetical protein